MGFYQIEVRSLSLTHWRTNWLTPRLVDLIDVTLACEDINSKLVVVIIADADAKKSVDI